MREVEHEIHQRRRSRNVGTALGLAALVAMIMALTVVKLRNLEPHDPAATSSVTP